MKSRYADRILTISIQSELNENDNENSITIFFNLEDAKNMIYKDIDEITVENNTTQHKQKLEQLKIEYLLCNTSTNAYITKITKQIKFMENNKHKEKNETYDMNMIINELPTNIFKWNHIFNSIKNKTPSELTPKIVHLCTNMNHINSNHNLQQLEL
jgi:hypothetical protein